MSEGMTPERLEELQARALAEMMEMSEAQELIEEIWRLRGSLDEVRRHLGEIMEMTLSTDQRRRVADAMRHVRVALRAEEDG